MSDYKQGKMEIGGVVATVIVVAVVVLGGLYFYQNSGQFRNPKDIADNIIINHNKVTNNEELTEEEQDQLLEEIEQTSDSVEIADIEEDLNVDVEVDLSALDDLESELEGLDLGI